MTKQLELVTVRTVYGRCRVSKEDLESGREQLRKYNQYGKRLNDMPGFNWKKHRSTTVHRGNLIEEGKACREVAPK